MSGGPGRYHLGRSRYLLETLESARVYQRERAEEYERMAAEGGRNMALTLPWRLPEPAWLWHWLLEASGQVTSGVGGHTGGAAALPTC